MFHGGGTPRLNTGGNMTFGEKIKMKRKELGMSQMELAEKTELSSACISLCEHNKKGVYFYTAVRIADALGVSLDWLAGRGE